MKWKKLLGIDKTRADQTRSILGGNLARVCNQLVRECENPFKNSIEQVKNELEFNDFLDSSVLPLCVPVPVEKLLTQLVESTTTFSRRLSLRSVAPCCQMFRSLLLFKTHFTDTWFYRWLSIVWMLQNDPTSATAIYVFKLWCRI